MITCNLHVVNHWRPNMSWLFFVVFNTTLKMFWELRPQGVSSSFTQQNLPKQSLSYIGVPLGLTLLLVNLFDFLIQRRPNEIWHNSVKLVDFNGSEYVLNQLPFALGSQEMLCSSVCGFYSWFLTLITWILHGFYRFYRANKKVTTASCVGVP